MLIRIIRKRQLKFFGRVIREESIKNLVVEGKIAGKRATGRLRITYIEGLTSSVDGNLTSNELLHAAVDRERCKLIVANVRN